MGKDDSRIYSIVNMSHSIMVNFGTTKLSTLNYKSKTILMTLELFLLLSSTDICLKILVTFDFFRLLSSTDICLKIQVSEYTLRKDFAPLFETLLLFFFICFSVYWECRCGNADGKNCYWHCCINMQPSTLYAPFEVVLVWRIQFECQVHMMILKCRIINKTKW